MRYLIILPFLFVSVALSAQFSVYLEQGMTVSSDTNYKPIGFGIDYQIAPRKGFEFSVGLAFDQVSILTDLPLAGEPRVCSGLYYYCNFDDSKLKSRESRVFIPLRVGRRTGRFTYGLELRPGLGIYDAIDFTYPQFESNYYDDSHTISGRYGRNIRRSDYYTETYTVNNAKIRVQLGTNLSYHISKRFSLGFSYRYEGFANKDIEVFFTPNSWAPPRFYSRGRSRAHYLVAMVRWSLSANY